MMTVDKNRNYELFRFMNHNEDKTFLNIIVRMTQLITSLQYLLIFVSLFIIPISKTTNKIMFISRLNYQVMQTVT